MTLLIWNKQMEIFLNEESHLVKFKVWYIICLKIREFEIRVWVAIASLSRSRPSLITVWFLSGNFKVRYICHPPTLISFTQISRTTLNKTVTLALCPFNYEPKPEISNTFKRLLTKIISLLFLSQIFLFFIFYIAARYSAIREI